LLDVAPIFDWLVEGAPGASSPPELVARMLPDLVSAGVAIDRFEAFVRTLHPHIVGRSFVWTTAGVEVREHTYAYLQAAFAASPAAEVVKTGASIRRRLGKDADGHLAELAREGYTDFYASALRFMSGHRHAVTFATRARRGFTDEELGEIERILAPLSRVAEIFALARTAANLLNTYVGHDAGERILAGKIQRGDTDSIHAVLWFSDLRGYTSLSASLPPAEIMRVLNDLFDCQVPAIERHGGEVLKFMGDGLLAIFPMKDGVAEDALAAADEAFRALDELNTTRTPPIQFGLALHVGEVSYGNIGGSGRLDFTCIGPAVNLASRMEGLTAKLGRRLVVSTELAKLTTRATEKLGAFELKGVEGLVDAYAIRDSR
jgi:adenylate cyclase